jgi:hypothetical protein
VAWNLRIVGFKLKHNFFFNYKYLHQSTTFCIEHKKSWDVYKHLQKLTKRCPCWWYKMKKFTKCDTRDEKPIKFSKFHMWKFLEIRSGYTLLGKFGRFKWVSKMLKLHCCDNCDIVFVKVVLLIEWLWKIMGTNTGCAQVH